MWIQEKPITFMFPFFKLFQREGIVTVKELSKGVESITAVNYEHERVRHFRLPASDAGGDPTTTSTTPAGDASDAGVKYTPPVITPLLLVNAATAALFAAGSFKFVICFAFFFASRLFCVGRFFSGVVMWSFFNRLFSVGVWFLYLAVLRSFPNSSAHNFYNFFFVCWFFFQERSQSATDGSARLPQRLRQEQPAAGSGQSQVLPQSFVCFFKSKSDQKSMRFYLWLPLVRTPVAQKATTFLSQHGSLAGRGVRSPDSDWFPYKNDAFASQ